MDFITDAWEKMGWTAAALATIIIATGTYFGRTLGMTLWNSFTALVKQPKQPKLHRHAMFAKYHYLMSHRLHNIHCRCILRSQIFSEVMILRAQVYEKILRAFIERRDLEGLSTKEFEYAIEGLLLNALTEWQERSKSDKVPEIVISRLLEVIVPIQDHLLLFVKTVAESTYTYPNNKARISAVFDMLCAFEEEALIRVEEKLDSMNGEISSCSYKGITCQHCKVCQSRHPRDNK